MKIKKTKSDALVEAGLERLNKRREVGEIRVGRIRAARELRGGCETSSPVAPIARAGCPYGYICPYQQPAPQQQAAPSVAIKQDPEYLSPYEIAAIYGLNINTVYTFIHDGKFDAFRVGRCWRVDAKSVKRPFNID